MTQHKVGIAEAAVCDKNDTIITIGLGSCIGVCLYDTSRKIARMVHIMLPDSTNSRNNTNRFKFADTGVPDLIANMEKMGASKLRMTAKIAGGAQMFSSSNASDIMKIGERNIEAVKQQLKINGIKLIAEDTGDNFGRTIELFAEDGSLTVKSIKFGKKVI